MQNTGTKFAGRIVSEGSTARTLKSAADEEARARMNNLQRQDGIFGESWIDSPQISILMESKINVQELIELHPGEFFSIFRGETVPSASFFIPDNEKSCSSDPVVINGISAWMHHAWTVSAVWIPVLLNVESRHRKMSVSSLAS